MNVITSYSIHYTKLYDIVTNTPEVLSDATAELTMMLMLGAGVSGVITSYSIHYTKLYDIVTPSRWES